MVGSVKQNFIAQGRPEPWKPLKINTLIARYLRNKPKQEKQKRFDPNPLVFKKTGRASKGSPFRDLGIVGDAAAVSTVAGFARSSKTGRVLRGRHRGLNKFAEEGYVFRREALRRILSGKILMDKGANGGLLGSISSSMDGKQRVLIGTNKVYAAPHQFGWPEKGITQRQFELIQEPEDENRFVELITQWLQNGRSLA